MIRYEKSRFGKIRVLFFLGLMSTILFFSYQRWIRSPVTPVAESSAKQVHVQDLKEVDPIPEEELEMDSTQFSSLSHSSKPGQEVKSQNPESERWSEFIEEAYRSIPTLDQLKSISDEESHHLPEILMKTGEYLGEIAQALSDNPQLADEVIRFYDRCLMNSQFPKPIRALCFSDLKKIKGETFDSSSVPDEIKLLAENL